MENNEVVPTTVSEEVKVQENEEIKTEAKPEVKLFSRDELNKIIAAERTKVADELKAQQNEAQKLAKMKEDERLQYEKEKAEKELSELKRQLAANNLKDEAYKIAAEKQIPISYLELIDFKTETAESINGKIQNISEARTKDLETYLNSKLKEPAPKQMTGSSAKLDPFKEGFEKGWKNEK